MRKLFIITLAAIIALALTGCPTDGDDGGGGGGGGAWDGVKTDFTWYTANPSAASFNISTPAQLAGLAAVVNGTWGGISFDFDGVTINQTKNINLGGNPWTPIGTNTARFEGHYIGMTISGLMIDSTGNYQGLFGVIGEDGQVDELTLKDVKIKGNNNVGGVAGRNYGAVAGCSVTGSVTGLNNIGGVAGVNNHWMTGCAFSGSVEGTSNYVGGITGICSGASATIERCSAAGSVTGGSYIGGIVGDSNTNSTIANCYATANVKATADATVYAGGIVGSLAAESMVAYCYATGSVDGDTARGISHGTGSTTNSVALNSSITGGGKARVCNTNGKNNYGRINMPEGNMLDGTWGNKGLNNPNGADVSPGTATDQYNNEAWWTTAGNWSGGAWDFTTIWEWDDTVKLPVLR